MKLRLLLAAGLLALCGEANAQVATNPFWTSVPMTPDLSVTASATADFPIPNAPLRWITIKNDCSSPLYFDLRGGRFVGKPATSFGMKLNAGESFTMATQVYSLGASPANANSATCTFTMQGGK